MKPTQQVVLESQARRLLSLAGLPDGFVAIAALPGGRNNRVYRVQTTHGDHLMKCYFHHPSDPRDRLGHETTFLSHLEQSGCRLAPRVLASIPSEHVALLEFVTGTRLQLEDIDADAVDQAARFCCAANRARLEGDTPHLPNASEACFSISEHLATTQRRVDRLSQIEVGDEIDAAAEDFCRADLIPVWLHVRAEIAAKWNTPIHRTVEIPLSERWLSPSDFGFHNALRTPDGSLCFLDFEYAGWDDPAKLICDFANQPDMLLPRTLSSRFEYAVIAVHSNPTDLARRVTALEPLYQVKWACICLNDFLASGRTRRRFTVEGMADDRPCRRLQLNRARTMLTRATAAPRYLLAS
jgi:hypothetical protein